jgi:hypothetical protein
MTILDNDHGQGFINSIGRDMINTNHSYFEKITSQPKEVYFCISKEF